MVLQPINQLLKPFVFFAFALILTGCDSNDGYDYDNGYESAWEEEKAPTRFSSQKYRDGYEQGLQDAATYNDGYDDGYNGRRPRYTKDPDYMDGFKDGKNDKSKGF